MGGAPPQPHPGARLTQHPGMRRRGQKKRLIAIPGDDARTLHEQKMDAMVRTSARPPRLSYTRRRCHLDAVLDEEGYRWVCSKEPATS